MFKQTYPKKGWKGAKSYSCLTKPQKVKICLNVLSFIFKMSKLSKGLDGVETSYSFNRITNFNINSFKVYHCFLYEVLVKLSKN